MCKIEILEECNCTVECLKYFTKLCKKSAIKQTAVGWLVDELQKAEYIPKNSAIIDYVINEAKQMEKQQQQGYKKQFKNK
jgi:hypothetical protein